MARFPTALIRSLLALFSLVFAASYASAIASIVVTPSRVPIQLQRPVDTTPFTFTWMVTAAPGPLRTISSPAGAFILDIGGRSVLASTGPLGPLTASQMTGPALFTEAIEIPAALVNQAIEQGARRILYVRTFVATYTIVEMVRDPTKTGPPVPIPVNRNVRTTADAAAVIDLSTGMGGPLRVFRAQLRFDDGSPLRVIEEDMRLRVFVDLSYTGGGTIEGVWELADANTTPGVAIFTPLVFVRRFLGAGQRVTIEAPPLPTHLLGKHLVRFRVTQPASLIEDPVVEYRVVTRALAAQVAPMSTSGPRPNAQLGPHTLFQWDPVQGTAAYQLELLDRDPGTRVPLFTEQGQLYRDVRSPGGDRLAYERAFATEILAGEASGERALPIAGMLLPPERLESELSVVALRHIEMGGRYLWRVRALAADGSTIGLSPLRPLRAPGAPLAPIDAPPPAELEPAPPGEGEPLLVPPAEEPAP